MLAMPAEFARMLLADRRLAGLLVAAALPHAALATLLRHRPAL